MAINISTNMTMPIPGVGTESGPQYATDINNCLTLVDQHNHSAGQGVQINSDGLNITSDLTIQNTNLTNIRSLRFLSQLSPISQPTDLGCLYESGVDLYYNDGAGNQVRITQSGGVAGSPGSIANLASPASASYVAANKTFVWESDANTPANMDFASMILRNLVANSKGLTVNPPSAMASDYTITMPALPASQKFMTLDNSGNMTAPWSVDGVTIVVSTNLLQIPAQAITQGLLALKATGTTVAAGGVAVSISTGAGFNTGSATPVEVSSITITTTGRPVFVGLTNTGDITHPGTLVTSSAGAAVIRVTFVRDTTTIVVLDTTYNAPASSFYSMDFPIAGTYTYHFKLSAPSGGTSSANGTSLVVYEL